MVSRVERFESFGKTPASIFKLDETVLCARFGGERFVEFFMRRSLYCTPFPFVLTPDLVI